MGRRSSRQTAVVADRRPLERSLARFLLEERGLLVLGEAATMADVLLQAQELRPDVLVLHEKLALDHEPALIAQIRSTSPDTRIVVLAADRSALPAALLLLADTVVEDGPGLTELGAAIAGPMATEPMEDVAGDDEVDREAAAGASSNARAQRWADRLSGLAVASVIALALLFARSLALLGPSNEAQGHLTAAFDSLSTLTSSLSTASPEEIAGIASTLVQERAAAQQAGADVSELDQTLLSNLDAIWASLPAQTRQILLAILGDVYSDNDVPPPPTASPPPTAGPPPTETVSPAPAISPSETPTPTSEPPVSTEPPATQPPITSEPPTTTTEPPTTTTETTTTETTTTTDPSTTTEPTSTTETTTSTTDTTTTEPTTTETTTTETTTTETTTTETTTEPTTTTEVTSTTEPTSTTDAPTTSPADTTTETTGPQTLKADGTRSDILLVPPAIVLLLMGSAFARRKATREDEPGDDR